jgi:hypothetical protein
VQLTGLKSKFKTLNKAQRHKGDVSHPGHVSTCSDAVLCWIPAWNDRVKVIFYTVRANLND